VSKKKATSLTPTDAKIELDVKKYVDPITKKDVFTAPDGYDANADDDAHVSTTQKPTISLTISTVDNVSTITATVTAGTFAITDVKVNDTSITASPGYEYKYTATSQDTTPKTISATVSDSGYYTIESTNTVTIPAYSA
jgi:hypothetical protein